MPQLKVTVIQAITGRNGRKWQGKWQKGTPNKTYQSVPKMYQFLPPAGSGRGVFNDYKNRSGSASGKLTHTLPKLGGGGVYLLTGRKME